MKIIFCDIDGVLNSQEWSEEIQKVILTKPELKHDAVEFAKTFCWPLGHLSPKLVNQLNIYDSVWYTDK